MAFLSDTFGFSPATTRARASWWDALTLRIRQRAAQQATYEELSRLTDRELADLGVSRHQIADIAREAAESI